MADHNGNVDVLHVRYNAVHPGAERDIFSKLPAPQVRPGIVVFTATCWGDLMKPDKVPGGDKVPTASDCYRFNLTNPAVDLCLTGPRSASDLAAALDALDKGPLTPEEMDWMRRVGAGKVPAALVDSVFRRFLRDHGQEIIAEHFELSLTLGESIVDTSYSDSGADSNGQLFLVLNTESPGRRSFPDPR